MCKECCNCRPSTPPRALNPEELQTVRDWINAYVAHGNLKIEPWRRAEFGALYSLYQRYTPTPTTLTRGRFGKALTTLGFPAARGTNGVRIRTGIGVPFVNV